MTTEQLVKTMRYCSDVGMCDDCWLTTIQKEFGAPFCDDKLKQEAADVIEQQAARIAELEAKVPRWISVDDRLPEKNVNCIVHYRHAYCDNDGYFAIGFCRYDGEKFEVYLAYKVTHWMSAPEPPEMDGGDSDAAD